MPSVTYQWGDRGALAVVLRDSRLPRLTGRERRVADEAAAAVARGLVHAAAPTAGAPNTVSISHTEGSAAALAWPERRMVGVDLIVTRRVTRRHANAILSTEDWSVLASVPPDLRAPVAWALKEATAKATGAAQKFFPNGIHLFASKGRGSPGTRCQGQRFDGDWFVLGLFICATVIARADSRLIADQARCKASAFRE
jgi:phosphopantetheinyl transferase (holo-ACP synthase)